VMGCQDIAGICGGGAHGGPFPVGRNAEYLHRFWLFSSYSFF
jgi:hypothetical protein